VRPLPLCGARSRADGCVRLCRVHSRQNTNKTLTHKANELNVELEKTKAEQADVYIYLHKKLDDNFDVIASLESKIEVRAARSCGRCGAGVAALTSMAAHAQELTTDRERADNLAARELATTKREAEQTISGLQQTVEELTDRLEALTEFKEKKDEIEARLAKCLAELESEREMRQAQVAELERRNVAAKDKLKKEMFVKIKETKQVRVAVAAAVVVRRASPSVLRGRTSWKAPTTSWMRLPNAPWQRTSK